MSPLYALLEAGVIRPIDLAFAEFVYQKEQDRAIADTVSMLAAVTSVRLGQQHSCLELASIGQPFAPYYQFAPLTQLLECLEHSSILGRAGEQTGNSPLIIDQGRLYLQRYWQHEQAIVSCLEAKANQSLAIDSDKLKTILDTLFETTAIKEDVDWQRVAVAVAVKQAFTIITGGPGTGKTTTVTKLMATLQAMQRNSGQAPFKIALCAPTGKAAARLNESIAFAKQALPEDYQTGFTMQCSTIHRLLGSVPNSPHFKANGHNPLHLDVLIVDEASMVDLPLMSRLVQALPTTARLILLGDQQQLASVEVGSVLSDMCAAAELPSWQADKFAYTAEQVEYLCAIGCAKALGGRVDPNIRRFNNNIVKLWHSHRFSADSGIGRLASVINRGELAKTKALLADSSWPDVHWHQDYSVEKVVNRLIPKYKDYFDAVKRSDLRGAFDLLQQHMLLCARQKGVWGVQRFNTLIELELQRQGLIPANEYFYSGRPIILNQNDHQLGLFNGDVGIVMADPQQPELLKVWFEQEQLYSVLPHQLPEHDSLFAMTIHKSQGSEFTEVHLCLPQQLNKSAHLPGLNRELLYTGLTRAKAEFHIYASDLALTASLAAAAKRGSGLDTKLRNYSAH